MPFAKHVISSMVLCVCTLTIKEVVWSSWFQLVWHVEHNEQVCLKQGCNTTGTTPPVLLDSYRNKIARSTVGHSRNVFLFNLKYTVRRTSQRIGFQRSAHSVAGSWVWLIEKCGKIKIVRNSGNDMCATRRVSLYRSVQSVIRCESPQCHKKQMSNATEIYLTVKESEFYTNKKTKRTSRCASRNVISVMLAVRFRNELNRSHFMRVWTHYFTR